MKKLLFFSFFIFIFQAGNCQKDSCRFPVIISVFNNASLLPGSGALGFINTPVHPGIRLGTLINYRTSEKSDLFETFNVSCFYHRLSQSSFQLYSELAYRYKFCNGFGADVQVLGGYMLAIPDIDVFERQSDGTYKKKTFLRSQFIGGAGLGLSYKMQKIPVRLFLNYQFYLQMPFVRNYVPMLPNTALHAGTIINFK